MWRPLNKITELIPNHKWKYFRKYRFKARYNSELNIADNKSEVYRVGGRYESYSISINLVPINHPARWITVAPENVEVFITDEEYRIKVLPIILSE